MRIANLKCLRVKGEMNVEDITAKVDESEEKLED